VVDEQASKTMTFGEVCNSCHPPVIKITSAPQDFQPEDVKTIYPYSRYQNSRGGMVFPSIIAKPGFHDTPRPLHVVNGLGEGTMGRVFLTLDSSTDKLYAMKVFNKEYVSACGEVENTVRERSLLAETRDNLFTINLQASFQDETRLFMLLVCAFHLQGNGLSTFMQDFYVGGDLATELTRYKGKIPMENTLYNAAHLVS
jgi:Protein kinase domain